MVNAFKKSSRDYPRSIWQLKILHFHFESLVAVLLPSSCQVISDIALYILFWVWTVATSWSFCISSSIKIFLLFMKYFLHIFEIVFKFIIWNILKIINILYCKLRFGRTLDAKGSQDGPQQPNLPDWSSFGMSSRTGLIPSFSKTFLIFVSAIFDQFDPNILSLNQNPNSREQQIDE